MAKRQAIRREGDVAVSRFLELVGLSKKTDNDKLGDVIVPMDGADHYVEVKECHAEKGDRGTINQVRAIKFITCVVCAPKQECWYVLSPDQLVRLAATKPRGQHTEIPFECMNFSFNSLSEDFHSKAKDAELQTKVHAAIRRGVKATNLQELMVRLLADIIAVKDRYIEEVRRHVDST